MVAVNAPQKRETLNLRIRPEERNLIDRAAKARGKNRTDFVLDAARLAAEEALLVTEAYQRRIAEGIAQALAPAAPEPESAPEPKKTEPEKKAAPKKK